MKNIAFLCGIMMICFAAMGQGVPSYVPTTGLVAYYGFDGNADDQSGNGNNGVLGTIGTTNPTPTADRFGNANSAYLFGGVDNPNYVFISGNSTLDFDTAISISFWMMQTANYGASTAMCNMVADNDNTSFAILSRGEDAGCSSDPGMVLRVDASGTARNVHFSDRSSQSSVQTGISVDGASRCYAYGEWIHCVVTSGGGYVCIYVNGMMVSSNNYSWIYNEINNLGTYIGVAAYGTEAAYPFNGSLDDIAIYNRGLTPHEVRMLYNGYADPIGEAQEPQIRMTSVDVVNPCGTSNGTITLNTASVPGVSYLYGSTLSETNLSYNNVITGGPGEYHCFVVSPCRLWDTIITLTCDCSDDPSLVYYDSVCPGTSGQRGGIDTVAYYTFESGTQGWTYDGYWGRGASESNTIYLFGTPQLTAYAGNYSFFCSNQQTYYTDYYFPTNTSYLVSPGIVFADDPSVTPTTLTFQFATLGFTLYADVYNSMSLQYATSPTGPWSSDMWSITNTSGGYGSWPQASVSLSSYLPSAGTYYFRIVNTGTGYASAIDNFMIVADTRWMIPDEVTSAAEGSTVTTQRTLSFTGACPVEEITNWYIYPTTHSDTTVYAPHSYTWNGVEYTETGVYQVTGLTNSNGCDSSATLHLFTDLNNSEDVYATACDRYIWAANWQTYTASTLDSVTGLVNVMGGDSTVRLHLTINNSSYSETVMRTCHGDYYWEGDYYSADTTVYKNYTTVAGCDSTLKLEFHRFYEIVTHVVDSMCEGSRYSFNGQSIPKAGEYVAYLYTNAMCDSIVNLTLTVVKQPAVEVGYAYDCKTGEYTVWGSTNAGYHRWYSDPADFDITEYEKDDTLRMKSRGGFTYTFYADKEFGISCPASASIQLPEELKAKAKLNVQPSYLSLDQLTLTAYDGSPAGLSREWFIDGMKQNETGIQLSYTSSIEADSVVVGLIVSSGECGDTAHVVLPVIRSSVFVPNVFMPTIPGRTDVSYETNNRFRAQGIGITDYEIHIYNRFGQQMFHSTDITESWDGFYADKLCPQGAYAYIIRYKDNINPGNWQYVKGTVTLIH